MKKKILYVILIVIFVWVDLYTAFLAFIGYVAGYKTIKTENQEAYIVKEIKEHFKIDYNINKVRFLAGIPDGYYLDIYNAENQVERVFEDNHENSEIYDYFRNVKADMPQHLIYLIIEILLELLVIFIIEILYKKNKKILEWYIIFFIIFKWRFWFWKKFIVIYV